MNSHQVHSLPMEQVWQWITSLPTSTNWPTIPLSLLLAASADNDHSILLKAERTAGSDSDTLVMFSISLQNFQPSKTLWVSNSFPLSSPNIHFLFLIQLVDELILPFHSPASISPSIFTCPNESVAAFFTISFLLRLFWLCAADAPAEAGFLFFRSIDSFSLERTLSLCKPAMRVFLYTLGVEKEEKLMRSLGYMVTKWSILRQLKTGPKAISSMPASCCLSFLHDAHGLWTLKGYAPILAMPIANRAAAPDDANDSVLRYAVAHHQLEAVIQLEHSISTIDPRFIKVSIRIDNIRLHIVKLGYLRENREEEEEHEMRSERHFASRVRVWAGPEAGTAYATGLSLSRSTGNPEREFETTRTVKGSFASGKAPLGMKAKSRASVRTKGRSWRWEQDAEGNAGVYEGVLCDGSSGAEVASGGGGGGGMGKRYSGVGRVFGKGGGVVFGEDEIGEGWVSWRVGREMEGRVLKWRIGGKIWVSYCANEVKSRYFETRCVHWKEDVDLALVGSC